MNCPKCKELLPLNGECRCGWKAHQQEIARPPVLCNACGKRPSTLNKVVVKTIAGHERCGAFWEYGRYDRSRRKMKLFLKPGFIFVRWETRCETCP